MRSRVVHIARQDDGRVGLDLAEELDEIRDALRLGRPRFKIEAIGASR